MHNVHRLRTSGAVALAMVLAAVVLLAANPRPAEATHLCGNTGSPFGPFDLQTYEAGDWRTTYNRTFELAGFNRLFPDVAGFNLPQLETGPRSAGSSQFISPYIPPTLLKAIAWLESSWIQADWSVPYGEVGPVLVSHDCGYGLMQITSGMQNVSGVPSLNQAMIGGHYAFNIAEGARILAGKWNAAPNYRPIVGNRDPAKVENWYYAVWSYNGFTFSNHPLSYSGSRPAYKCDGTQPRSNYPYQELVFGCVANPPIEGGVLLWDPLEVTLPNPSDPAFSLSAWNACSSSVNCADMDLLTPSPSHTDTANTSLSRSQVIGSPSLTLSTNKATLLAAPGGESLPLQLTATNSGTGAMSWSATTSESWLEITDHQGVSLGADLGLRTAGFAAKADASGLADGTYAGKIKFESPHAGNSPYEVDVTLHVGDLCDPFLDLLESHGACFQIQALYNAGITSGCAVMPPAYCPGDNVSRAEIAVFILKAMRHGNHLPNYRGYFSDVLDGRWYTGYIEHLFEHGITLGYPDGTFRPNVDLSRAQAAVMIVHGLGETPVEPPKGAIFGDVSASHWAAGYIERLAQWGITAGYTNGTYRPEKTLSRGEAAILIARAWSLPYVTRDESALFILRAMGNDEHLSPYNGYFADVPSDRWYTGYVEHFFAHGITSGYPDGTYRPDNEVSRAVVATFLVRALDETAVDPPPREPSSVTSPPPTGQRVI